jgi:hypothetical protein
MTITTDRLTRAAGLSAAAAGVIFIAVQINHPAMDVSSVNTTDWTIRFTAKIVMCGLALAGLAGIYLRQVRQLGVVGLVGYAFLSVFYVLTVGVEFTGGYVLPALADSSPGYVNDVLAAAEGGTATGDIGILPTVLAVAGVAYILGGLLFGIALFRAGVLARWAAALLAVTTVSTAALVVLPESFNRPFAVPMGIALIGLGLSLRGQAPVESESTSPATSTTTPAVRPTMAR